MSNVEIVLAVIVIAAIIVILNYLLDDRTTSSIPFINGAKILIQVIKDTNPPFFEYSLDRINWIIIQNGQLQFPIHSQTVSIRNNGVDEISFTEMPNNCYIETIHIIIDNSAQINCNTNMMQIQGSIKTIMNTAGLTVRDVNNQQNPRVIYNDNYSGCYGISNQCAMLDFTWPNVGSVGLKIKKRIRNSITQINVVLTNVNPIIPPNLVFNSTTAELPSTSNPDD